MPVYENGKIIGALAASDHIEIFSDILSGNTVFGGGGYIHLIDSEGDFLVRSSNSVVKDNVPSIFEGPYLSGESRSNVEDALENQKRIFSSFSYNGRDYPFLLEPIGLNNWYLFCVNTGGQSECAHRYFHPHGAAYGSRHCTSGNLSDALWIPADAQL